MVKVHFNFRLDVPIVLNRYSIFDSKSGKEYVDFEKTSNRIKSISSKISEANGFLLELADRQFGFSLTLPGYAVEHLAKENKQVIAEFRSLLLKKDTEIIATTYYNSFCYTYADSELKNQIQKEKDYIQTHFGKTPETFTTHFSPNKPDFYTSIKDMGFGQIYISGYNRFEDEKNHNMIFSLKDEGLNLIFRHHDFSLDLNDRFFKEPLDADDFIASLKGSEESIVNITVEYDTLYSEGFREFFKDLAYRMQEDDDIQTIIPKGFSSIKHRDIKDSSALEMGKQTLTEMQKDAIDKLYSIEKGIEMLADSDILFDWRLLHNLHFVRDFSQNSRFRWQDNHENHYELYVSYMNIIEDLKRRLKAGIKESDESMKEKALNIDLS